MNITIQPPTLAADELAAWLTLAHTPRVPVSSALALLAAFGSPRQIMTETVASLEQVVGAAAAQAVLQSRDAVAPRLTATLEWAASDACSIVPFGHPAYPPALLTLYDPPPLLYVHGAIGALHQPSLAIVGSRNPTPQGSDNARLFAQALAAHGVCIVSGLALGIDGAAHRGALDGAGVTVAIIGSGADIVYPSRHAGLAAKLVEHGGAIVTEWPLGAAPLHHHFPQRNRLIAALVRGVLVVEAAPYSGSLITARLANDIGRDVFAIPGSIHSPMSRGCHRLIKDGAKLAETPHDVLTELRLGEPGVEAGIGTGATAGVQVGVPTAASGDVAASRAGATRAPGRCRTIGPWSSGRRRPARMTAARDTGTPDTTPEPQRSVLAAVGHDPVTLETLVERTHLDCAILQAMLLELELAGTIVALPGGRFQHCIGSGVMPWWRASGRPWRVIHAATMRCQDYPIMPALDLDHDADAIAARLSSADTLFVACLCAEWCGSCREYRVGFDVLADAYPHACFVWIDIETHADRLDDIDVENFPTILIEDAHATRFFGTVLPHPQIVARMLVDLSSLPGVERAPKLRPALVDA
ncbi:hypothetical protein DFQ28_009453 [Apophysomyces sp. BC1034]|nr:hypothetical protein DFQ28_009453 [Apophysomyces sp. BC1034]